MNLAMPTGPAIVSPTLGESEQPSFTRETLSRATGEDSLGANLNTSLCVTGRAYNCLELWYNFSSPGGPQKEVPGCDDCSVSGPRMMSGGSVSGDDHIVRCATDIRGREVAASTWVGRYVDDAVTSASIGLHREQGWCAASSRAHVVPPVSRRGGRS